MSKRKAIKRKKNKKKQDFKRNILQYTMKIKDRKNYSDKQK